MYNFGSEQINCGRKVGVLKSSEFKNVQNIRKEPTAMSIFSQTVNRVLVETAFWTSQYF